MGSNTELVVRKQQTAKLEKWRDSSRNELLKLIPKHIDGERMLQLAVYAAKTDSKLMQCDLASIADCVVRSAQMGLELNGVLGHAYMVPRRNKGTWQANFQLGYQGKIQLLMRSGLFEAIDWDAVYTHDTFDYERGSRPTLRHKQSLKPERKEEPPLAFYAIAYPKGGGVPTFTILTLKDIQDVRDGIRNLSDQGPWTTHPEAMAIKTVIHRLCKKLPQATEAFEAARQEDRTEAKLQGIVVDQEEVPAGMLEDVEPDPPRKGGARKSSQRKKADNTQPDPPAEREPGQEG